MANPGLPSWPTTAKSEAAAAALATTLPGSWSSTMRTGRSPDVVRHSRYYIAIKLLSWTPSTIRTTVTWSVCVSRVGQPLGYCNSVGDVRWRPARTELKRRLRRRWLVPYSGKTGSAPLPVVADIMEYFHNFYPFAFFHCHYLNSVTGVKYRTLTRVR